MAIEVLLTGASGFVGRHLATALATQHEVIRLNRRITGAAGEIVHDLAEPLPFARLPRRVDVVIHAAGLVGQAANASPLCQRVNVDAAGELADYAVGAGAKSFILLSTGGVYRRTEEKLTERSALGPADNYGRSKLAAEELVQRRGAPIDVKILRLFFPYGPTQTGRLIPNLIERVATGKPISLLNASGQPLLTPIYIDDLVECMRRVLKIAGTFVANVAGHEVVSIRTLGEMIGNKLGQAVSFTIEDHGQAYNLRSDTEQISLLTGYAPLRSMQSGLTRTMDAATTDTAR